MKGSTSLPDAPATRPWWASFKTLLCGLLLGGSISGLAAPTVALDCPPAVETTATAPAPGAWQRGLLWEVRAPDGAISHLYGTIHLSDADGVRLSPLIKSLLGASREFGMEMRLDADTLQGLANSVIAAPGQGLAARAEPAGQLKPWAVWSTLALPAGAQGPPLDLVLMQAAESAQVPVFGLETLAEQLAIFEGLSPDDELALLRDSVCDPEGLVRDRESMREAWQAGDLATIYAQGLADDSPLNQRLMARLRHARNARMAERVLPHFRAGGAFVAVGALHLPGQDGLLARLVAQGFVVKALD